MWTTRTACIDGVTSGEDVIGLHSEKKDWWMKKFEI
jgi:hypothetical protein